MKTLHLFLATIFVLGLSKATASDLKENTPAPVFKSKLHDGSDFDLADRKGKWTVLFFYPKAGTPGCTKQACAFRDSINVIRELGAEVYGVSADSQKAQAEFHKEHRLGFPLIADPDGKVIALYGTKVPMMNMSKRWTFIIDPELKIRKIEKDVDPALDAKKVAEEIKRIKN